MSSAPLPQQHIHGTSATGGSLTVAGAVYGNVTVGAREPSVSQAPTRPLCKIPFRRDRDFIDRSDLLSQIDKLCSESAGRAALVGLGGVGKSQLAIEHAYRTRDRSPDTWVFWVHASNAARFEQGYRDIAEAARISERTDPKANIFKLVHDWLVSHEGRWLMILDNVDDAAFLVDTQSVSQSQPSESDCKALAQLRNYLPQSQNGSIVITSRNYEAARTLVEESEIIPIKPMEYANAVELLHKKLGSIGQVNDKDIAELVATLEFMPLAIVQAASYISQLAPRCSVQQYIKDFRRSDQKKSSLLNHEGGHLRRDSGAKNSIILTWQISFEHIHRTRQSAADLLSLMSFFDSQGIPELLVRDRPVKVEHGECQAEENSTLESTEDEGFEGDVQMLRNFSFISLDTADSTVFEMHKLVQLATWKWLEARDQFEMWKQRYIKKLFTKSTPKYENWAKYAVIFPHVQSAIAQRPKERDSLLKWASVMYDGAWYAWKCGNIAGLLEMSTLSTKTRKEILGQEDKATLRSMTMVGNAHAMMGRWKEAEELDVQVFETRKRVLGQDHPDTFTSMNNLGSTYRARGYYNQAEQLQAQVVKISKEKLGADHRKTLTYMNQLALTYNKQGRQEEAEELDMQVFETRKRVLGHDHPATVASMHNLALTYSSQGRWKEAEELQVQVIEMSNRFLGQDHPDTLISMHTLALTYTSQGRWKEAEELQMQVIETRKRVLGHDHPRTLKSMKHLAFIIKNKGEKEEGII